MTGAEPIIELIRQWFWIPFITVLCSAVGFHLKTERENRKAMYKAIKDEHKYVEDNYVRKDTLEHIQTDIGEVKEELKHLRRDLLSGTIARD